MEEATEVWNNSERTNRQLYVVRTSRRYAANEILAHMNRALAYERYNCGAPPSIAAHVESARRTVDRGLAMLLEQLSEKHAECRALRQALDAREMALQLTRQVLDEHKQAATTAVADDGNHNGRKRKCSEEGTHRLVSGDESRSLQDTIGLDPNANGFETIKDNQHSGSTEHTNTSQVAVTEELSGENAEHSVLPDTNDWGQKAREVNSRFDQASICMKMALQHVESMQHRLTRSRRKSLGLSGAPVAVGPDDSRLITVERRRTAVEHAAADSKTRGNGAPTWKPTRNPLPPGATTASSWAGFVAMGSAVLDPSDDDSED